LSAVLVFAASSLIHMVLKYHQKDFGKLANEDAVLTVLRTSSPAPGEYAVPHATGMEAMKDPAFVEKVTKGPVVFMAVRKPGAMSMGPMLVQWFIYCVVVSLFAGYVASRAVGPGAEYLQVFRFAGTVAFAGYGLALWQNTIWYARPVRTTLIQTIDSLIYACLTAGVFGWLWPR